MAKSNGPKASSSARVAQSLSGHAAIAFVVGGLIYILSLTGILSVFNHELQRWEQPGAPEFTAMAPAAAAAAAASVLTRGDGLTPHLYVKLPTEDLPRAVITTDTEAFFANADGAIVGVEAHPWTQFVLDLHYYLHLPQRIGLIVVGALGVMLLGLSVTGFLAYPRIFRDAFRFRRGAGRLTQIDIHNRLSVWTAPFHISSALTGAIIGLASILAVAIAVPNFQGETDAVFDPLFGGEPAGDSRRAPLAAIAEPLRVMARSFPDVIAEYVILHDPGTAGQHVTVLGRHNTRLIFGEYYNFDAAGNFAGTVGLADGSTAQQIAASIYQVHFGFYGGLPVKLAYLAFGLALAVVIASGMTIYFAKRREKGSAAPRLEAAWAGIVWGVPFALALTLLASVSGVIGAVGLAPLFWSALALALFGGLRTANRFAVTKVLRAAGGGALFAGVVTHIGMHSADFDTSAAAGVLAAFTLVALVLLANFLRAAFRTRRV